jgi:hypothetical protein
MEHYTRLAVLALRTMGIIVLLYATPMVAWGILRLGFGATKASDGVTSSGSAFAGWLIYEFAGILMLLLARPLGRFAARGLDSPTIFPPAS